MSTTESHDDAAALDADLAATCERLQQELDALMGEQDGEEAARSLDGAVSSLKRVQQQNVSSVQLVALTTR